MKYVHCIGHVTGCVKNMTGWVDYDVCTLHYIGHLTGCVNHMTGWINYNVCTQYNSHAVSSLYNIVCSFYSVTKRFLK